MDKEEHREPPQPGIGYAAVFALVISVLLSVVVCVFLSYVSRHGPIYCPPISQVVLLVSFGAVFVVLRYVAPDLLRLLRKHTNMPLLGFTVFLYLCYQVVCAASLEWTFHMPVNAMERCCPAGFALYILYGVSRAADGYLYIFGIFTLHVPTLLLLFFPIVGGPIYGLLVLCKKLYTRLIPG